MPEPATHHIAAPFSLTTEAVRNAMAPFSRLREGVENLRAKMRAAADREYIRADLDHEPLFYARGAELDGLLAHGERGLRVWLLSGERNAGLIAERGERYLPTFARPLIANGHWPPAIFRVRPTLGVTPAWPQAEITAATATKANASYRTVHRVPDDVLLSAIPVQPPHQQQPGATS